MSEVEVKQIIMTNLSLRGGGKEGEPYRRITEIWDMEGNKITEIDPVEKMEGGKKWKVQENTQK